MKLIIGGYAQGKLEYALKKSRWSEDAVWDAVLPDGASCKKEPFIINHFHLWVRERLLNGGCPEEEAPAFFDRCGDCVIISDEIGNGIVPTDPFEREYRERAGRVLALLAKRAEEVERVICGIGQRIK